MVLARYLVLVGIGLLLLPMSVLAQATPTCPQSAARAISGAASEDDLAVLLDCESERGPAYAAYLRHLASVRDTLKLQAPFGGANFLRDGLVFEALLAIARDPAATIPARVYSIIALIFHEAGSTGLNYEGATSVSKDDVCAVGGLDGVEEAVERGAPLPADHRKRSNAMARHLETDPDTPAAVQSAARCLLAATGGVEDELTQQPVNWAGIDLTYVCDNVFRARNSNRRAVEVQFEVENPTRRARIVLPPNGHSQGGYSEITFPVPGSGTLRFKYNGTVMKSARNGGTPCS